MAQDVWFGLMLGLSADALRTAMCCFTAQGCPSHSTGVGRILTTHATALSRISISPFLASTVATNPNGIVNFFGTWP